MREREQVLHIAFYEKEIKILRTDYVGVRIHVLMGSSDAIIQCYENLLLFQIEQNIINMK